MFVARRVALKTLPFLVLVWTAVAVLGVAVHQADQSGVAKGSAAETGLGLCAAGLAVLAGTRVLRFKRPRLVRQPARALARSWRTRHPWNVGVPPPPSAPRLHLLQILRT